MLRSKLLELQYENVGISHRHHPEALKRLYDDFYHILFASLNNFDRS